ncbi:hypothetical protein J6S88_06420 [bacterium]|nr:hypothetical protein [bacterium]
MRVTQINNYQAENNDKQSFKAFRVSHSKEMKSVKRIFKKNCPDFYNNLINNLQEILKKTGFFDGLLDIEHGQLVLRLQHRKNFIWPGTENSIIHKNTTNYMPNVVRNTKSIEFNPDYDRTLKLKKIREDDYKITYSLQNWITDEPHRYNEWWTGKASIAQAKLIKELDDTVIDMASNGKIYLGYDALEEMAYFPIKN